MSRVFPAPLARVGACLERALREIEGWEVRQVEHFEGRVEVLRDVDDDGPFESAAFELTGSSAGTTVDYRGQGDASPVLARLEELLS